MAFQIFQAIEYFALLVVLTVLWINAFRQPAWRSFWAALALAWMMNLFGNVAWIVHDLVTGTPLDSLSAVDLFYALRYVLIGIVLWAYPRPLRRNDGIWTGAIAALVNALIWVFYYHPAVKLTGGNWLGLLGLALYPLLDATVIVLAWLRFRAVRGTLWDKAAWLLFLAAISYGIANTFNLTEYIFSFSLGGWIQNIFWLLTDVLFLILARATDLGQPVSPRS